MNNTFGDNVKRIREEKGLTQDELAKKAGYTSRSTISCIENGKRDCSQKQIVSVANALGVSPGELLGKQNLIIGTEVRKIIKQIANELDKSYDELEKLYLTKEFPRVISYKSLLYFFSVYLDKPLRIAKENTSSVAVETAAEERLIAIYRNLNEKGKEKFLDTAEDMSQLDRYKQDGLSDGAAM